MGPGALSCAGLGGRLGLNLFIQTGQVYTYKIPMGNRVRIIASKPVPFTQWMKILSYIYIYRNNFCLVPIS
jgi:hypothetical protein